MFGPFTILNTPHLIISPLGSVALPGVEMSVAGNCPRFTALALETAEATLNSCPAEPARLALVAAMPCTNAVVASRVELSVEVCVVAVGLPVKAGLFSGA